MSNIDDLFSALAPSADTIQSRKASIANYQAQRGAKMLQDGRTEEAITCFKAALATDSTNVDNYTNLGKTQMQAGKNDDAIATFKKLVSMKPFDTDAATNLGNAYAQAKKYTSAAESYEKAAKLDPSNTTAIYSAGQSYLLDNKLSKAAETFQKVIRLKPNDPNGYYALGQTYNKMGNYDSAISNLKQAVNLKHEFYTLAETELGYAYAGKNEDNLVQRQIDRLNDNDQSTAADELESDTTKPKFTTVGVGDYNAFYPSLGPNTSLERLTLTESKQTLSQANATKSFTMEFYFNTDMDVTSVQTLSNWQISKANGGKAGYYNYGYTQHPDKEAAAPIIQSIAYNVDDQKATVTFSLTQNSNADAVIDPSHLVFKFSGKDVNGKSMDPTANAYDYANGVFEASKVSIYG